ncbi:MAG TPA: SH3 domain-containing protein, partial [Pyrinomonadaceae bacterium]|nr:SH3 domain-containing protein [Pyrinomonadaceae bacterium]
MKANRFVIFTIVLFFAIALSGCGLISGAIDNISNVVGTNDTGTVIIKRAQIRSSYAVVAADLLEVKRGDKLDILAVEDFEKVRWYRVRAHDDEQTEGWIEAQNIITGSLLDKSKKLAEEVKDLQPQATGQLRAVSNLRLSPEQREDNLIYKLENGATFQIINWKYVPKVVDPNEANKKSKNDEVESAKEANKPEDMDDKYDIWYQVRLTPDVSPAPAGWLFGRQVGLEIPTDIAIFQKESNKIITWQKIDGTESDQKFSSKDSATKISTPGSWVILLRSNDVKSTNGDEPDFDSILVLGYDKYGQEHYTAYRNSKVEGKIPLKLEGTGDNK